MYEGNQTAMKASSTIQQISPVQASIGGLRNLIGDAHIEINELAGRLASVSNEAVEKAQTAGGVGHAPASCTLEAEVQDMARSVSGLIERIRSTRQNLCV